MHRSERTPQEIERIREFYAAIKGGDLNKVKAMLLEDPGLLYADVEEWASPAREALAAGHDDITDYLAREELRRLEVGTVPEKEYRTKFESMMFDDPDEEVRRMVAASLGSVLERSRDWGAGALLYVWFGTHAEHRFFLKVLNAEEPLERAARKASDREDYETSLRLSEEAARVWEAHVDQEFIATLERGEEP